MNSETKNIVQEYVKEIRDNFSDNRVVNEKINLILDCTDIGDWNKIIGPKRSLDVKKGYLEKEGIKNVLSVFLSRYLLDYWQCHIDSLTNEPEKKFIDFVNSQTHPFEFKKAASDNEDNDTFDVQIDKNELRNYRDGNNNNSLVPKNVRSGRSNSELVIRFFKECYPGTGFNLYKMVFSYYMKNYSYEDIQQELNKNSYELDVEGIKCYIDLCWEAFCEWLMKQREHETIERWFKDHNKKFNAQTLKDYFISNQISS